MEKEKQILTNNNWISGLAEEKKLTKITGTLASSIQLRGGETKEPYYYAFIRLKGQKVDLPVVFKIKNKKSCSKCGDNPN